MVAEINNTTPHDVTGLQLVIQFTGPDGRVQRGSRSLEGVMKAHTKQLMNLGIQNPPEVVQRSLRAQIGRARLAGGG